MATRAFLTEAACASMWPLSMWVYATATSETPLFVVACVGILQYLACITLAAFTLDDAEAEEKPLLSGAHAGACFLLGHINKWRYLRVIAAQFAGQTLALWLLERRGVHLNLYWDSLRLMRPWFWGLFIAEVGLVSLTGALPLMARRMREEHGVFARQGPFRDMISSGIWIGTLTYPWGGVTTAWGSWRWMAILYEQPPWILAVIASIGLTLQCCIATLLVVLWTPPAAASQNQPPPLDDDDDDDEQDEHIE